MSTEFLTADMPREAFFRQLKPYAHCDVLIDRAVAESLYIDVPQLDDEVLEKQALYDRIFTGRLDETPLLVRIPRDQLGLLDQLLAYAIKEVNTQKQTRSVCGFLLGVTDSLVMLGVHLSTHLDPQVEGTNGVFFRYFDPRVVQLLPRWLTQQQMHNLLRPMEAWVSINWQGEQHTQQRPQPVPPIVHGTPSYTAPQWERIERGSLINQVAWKLHHKKQPVLNADLIEPLIIQAAEKYLNTDDQVNYAVFACIYGRKFTGHGRH